MKVRIVIVLGIVGFCAATIFLIQRNTSSETIVETPSFPDLSQRPQSHSAHTLFAYAPTGVPRFTFLYPNEFDVIEIDEGNGSWNYVIEDQETGRGIQVFITPYAEPAITQERLALDQPLGISDTPVSVTVDGASGMMFSGKHPDIGDTKEVWFIKGGYLFEVYTYNELTSLLEEIMGTWDFLDTP